MSVVFNGRVTPMSHTEGRTEVGDIWEQDAEEDFWI